MIGSVALFFAVLPSLWPSRWANGLSLFPVLAIMTGLAKLTWLHRATGDQLITLIAGVLSDALMLALVRYAVRKVSARPTLVRVSLAVVAQLAVITLLVILPFEASGQLMVKFGNRLMFKSLLWLGLFNLFTGLAASVFLIVLFFVLLHRVTWPIIGRLIYPFARYEVPMPADFRAPKAFQISL